MTASRKRNDNSTLAGLGEAGALASIRRFISGAGGDVLVGIGDDTAAVRIANDGNLLLHTADMLVEGTHFLRDPNQWEAVGRKAIAVNVSDIAAMGGSPLHAVVSLGAPPTFLKQSLLDLYRGLRREARRWRIQIVGGDTVRAPVPVIAVALTGTADSRRALPLRGRCRPGQALYVTGTLGGSAAGLALLTSHGIARFLRERWAERLIARHRVPQPRLRAGQALAGALADLAMIDVSDGVEHEAGLLSQASSGRIQLEVPALPISGSLRSFAQATKSDPAAFALRGGEDFELLFATSAPVSKIRSCLRSAGPRLPVARIGVISEGRGIVISNPPGRGPAAFAHFA